MHVGYNVLRTAYGCGDFVEFLSLPSVVCELEASYLYV